MEITDVNTLFGAYPAQHADSSPETLVEAMRANGIDWGLTLSTYGLFHDAAEGNAETMKACRAHDHLIPVATLNPVHYWGQEGLVESVAENAFEMVRFFPHLQGWPLEFAPFLRMLSVLGRLPRMPIMVSVDERGDATQLARLLDDFPHAVVLDGVSPETLTEAIMLMRVHENLYVETHALTAPYALPLLRDTVGIGRVLFGSDAPGRSPAAALRYVRSSGLSDTDQAAVLSGNAQAIWQAGGEE
jgi:predicted TIM-barrel fold metal-dependent hydrolase